jgi:thiamine transport system permease protein
MAAAVAGHRQLGRDVLGAVALAAVPVGFVVLFFVVPVTGMLRLGLWPQGRLDVAGAFAVLGRGYVARAIWFTVWSSAAATAIAVVLGLPAAYALHRLRWRGAGLVRALLLVPFVLPTVVVGIAFRELLHDGGLLGWLHLDGTAWAVVAGLAYFNVAVVIRIAGAAWSGLDPRLGEVAAGLGASPTTVFRTITLPVLRPAIVSAASVVFLFCATSFGVVLTLGGLHYSSVETEIYLLTTNLLDLRGAAALSIVQLLAVVALLLLAGRLRTTPSNGAQTVAFARPPRRSDAGAVAATLALVVLVLLPLVTLVVGSLHAGGHWSTLGYRDLASGDGCGGCLPGSVVTALVTSLRISAWAALLSLGLGLLVAVVVTRRSASRAVRRIGTVVDGLVMLPLGVSAVTLGFGLLVTLDRPPVDFRSEPWLVPVAQALVALPLVVRTLVPVLASVDEGLRESAAGLGASPLRVVLTIDLPLVRRSLLVAAGFAFAVSLGEFGATSFLARPQTLTLPVAIYRVLGHPGEATYPMALAASVVLAAVTTAVIGLIELVHAGGGPARPRRRRLRRVRTLLVHVPARAVASDR